MLQVHRSMPEQHTTVMAESKRILQLVLQEPGTFARRKRGEWRPAALRSWLSMPSSRARATDEHLQSVLLCARTATATSLVCTTYFSYTQCYCPPSCILACLSAGLPAAVAVAAAAAAADVASASWHPRTVLQLPDRHVAG